MANFETLETRIVSVLNQVTQTRGTDREIELLLVATDLLTDAHMQVESLANELSKMADNAEATIRRCPVVSESGGNWHRLPKPGAYPLPDVDFVRRFMEGHERYSSIHERWTVLANDFKRERAEALKVERKGRTGVSLAGLSLLALTEPCDKFEGREITENHLGGVVNSIVLCRPGQSRWSNERRVRLSRVIRRLRRMDVKGVRAGKALAERTMDNVRDDQNRTRPVDELAVRGKSGQDRFRRLAPFMVPRTFDIETFNMLFASENREPVTQELAVRAFVHWNWQNYLKFANRLKSIPQGFRRPGAVLRNWGNAHCRNAFPHSDECPMGEPVTVGYFVPPGTEITIEREGFPVVRPVPCINQHYPALPPESFERKGDNGQTLPALPWVMEVPGLPETVPVIRFETVQMNEHSQREPWLFVLGRTSKKCAELLGQDRLHQRQAELQAEGFRRMLGHVRRTLAEKESAEKIRKERGKVLLYLYRKDRAVRVLDSRQVGNCLGGTLSWCESLGLRHPQGTNPDDWELPVRTLVRAILRKGQGAFSPNAVRVLEKLYRDGQELDRQERERAELELAGANGTEGGAL